MPEFVTCASCSLTHTRRVGGSCPRCKNPTTGGPYVMGPKNLLTADLGQTRIGKMVSFVLAICGLVVGVGIAGFVLVGLWEEGGSRNRDVLKAMVLAIGLLSASAARLFGSDRKVPGPDAPTSP